MGVTLAVILSRRTMYAILFLILLFSLVAVFIYSLGVDFIGLIFVIVYVGAIATLFLFIVMMLGGEDWDSREALDLETSNLLHGSGFGSARWWAGLNKISWFVKYLLLDVCLIFVMGASLLSLFSSVTSVSFASWLEVAQTSYSTNMFNTSFLYGVFFYENWYLPFLIAGVVLLVAMLGSIILTTRLVVPAGKEGKSTNLAPSPLLAKVVEKQKLEYEFPAALWVPQLLWSGFCVFVGLVLKDYFITSELSRWIFVITISSIYLVVSYKLVDRLATKRAAKYSRKS
jgi:NADH-quinone oxidoreductase subunit J